MVYLRDGQITFLLNEYVLAFILLGTTSVRKTLHANANRLQKSKKTFAQIIFNEVSLNKLLNNLV